MTRTLKVIPNYFMISLISEPVTVLQVKTSPIKEYIDILSNSESTMGDSLYEFAASAKERIDNRITVICTRSRNLTLLLRECKIEIEAKNGKTGLLAEWINEIIENVEKAEGDVTRVRQIHGNQYRNYILLPAY